MEEEEGKYARAEQRSPFPPPPPPSWELIPLERVDAIILMLGRTGCMPFPFFGGGGGGRGRSSTRKVENVNFSGMFLYTGIIG